MTRADAVRARNDALARQAYYERELENEKERSKGRLHMYGINRRFDALRQCAEQAQTNVLLAELILQKWEHQ